MPADWASIRHQFPALENWTYLNTATYGQLPLRAVKAVSDHFKHRDELACADFLDWFDEMDDIRESIGKLVRCSSNDVAFIPNAATALSLLLGGIEWRRGDQVVTLENEFPNNLYYAALLGEQGVELIETSWDDFYDALTPATRMVLMSTANYITGFQPPLAEIARVLRERGVTFYLDGTQSIGAVPFDIAEIQPDMLAVHGYKWLLSPNGAGFMYVRPELRRQLRPAIIGWRSDKGWRSVDALSHSAPEFVGTAEQYEGGMLNFPSLYAMGASIEMMLGIGREQIHQRVLDLARLTSDTLKECGATIAHEGSPIIAARFRDLDASQLARTLKDRRILVSARHGYLRVSVHYYNIEADVQALAEAIRSMTVTTG
jgi:selenocysteine lyase/cysteine desulfurase